MNFGTSSQKGRYIENCLNCHSVLSVSYYHFRKIKFYFLSINVIWILSHLLNEYVHDNTDEV